ncbi:Pyrokinin 1 receptor [Carabus blaptoides fortunei]
MFQGFAAETSANATVLTITAFTIERYVAICHPFLSHTMSKLSRAVRYIVIIWILALCLAVPQAMSFGILYEKSTDGRIINNDHSVCTIKEMVIPHAFEISTFVFFIAPMTLITILYVLIGVQLKRTAMARGGKCGSSVRLKHRYLKTKRSNSSVEKTVVIITPNCCATTDNEKVISKDIDTEDGRKNYPRNAQNYTAKHVVKMLGK